MINNLQNNTNMFRDSLLVGMTDQVGVGKKIRVIDYKNAQSENEAGMGIFVTINGFNGRRVKECLTSINAWAIDLDEGSKQEQVDRISRSPLVPTMIVESKNGFHVWWAAKDGSIENYNQIVGERLVPFFGADKNAKDVCRLLRMPGFYHMKDPQNPFLVTIKLWNPRMYTEAEMLRLFPEKQKPKINNHVKKIERKDWDKSKELDCTEGLKILSGTHWVNGDIFDFKDNSNGTKQIWVNGKSSSCWIDKNGLIGSLDNGGPSLWQYLNWYYKDYKKVSRIMRDVFDV